MRRPWSIPKKLLPLFILFILLSGDSLMAPSHEKSLQYTNRLIHEKSPYLLQHAHNPVDWYPWGPEAFARAAAEDKPIFLSIGYSTCHWCHVMERECFEDPEVARLLNETFISIKVDREERPDIDNIYMTACQLMTGSGGWPLTIIMTPDKRPFFAGTYIPKENRFGRMGLMTLIPKIKELWQTKRDSVLKAAGEITGILGQSSHSAPGEELTGTVLKDAYEKLADTFDPKYGGFGNGQKFPTPHNLLFLLRYWKRTGEAHALKMVTTTLRAMRRGGVFDHIGSGFHRYSTDPQWLVPHFEKMLYDQALLAMAYLETYQATGNALFKDTAGEIFTYVRRDMKAPSGGFYSAQDADSEGEEGRVYLWSEEEVRRVLGKEDADLFFHVFNFKKEGNFRDQASNGTTGFNIPHRTKSFRELALERGMSEAKFRAWLERSRDKLLVVREKRVQPFRDDKILADWNGLMIAALARGARVLDQPEYGREAEQALAFILKKMRSGDGRILHRFRDGEAAIPGFLNDYAFLIWGLTELYETTFNPEYLEEALRLQGIVTAHFLDKKGGGFYFAPDDNEALLARKKVGYDAAIPSGNSVMMLNLLRLGRLTANPGLEDQADRLGKAFSEGVKTSPVGFTMLLTALDFALSPSHEVVIVGKPLAGGTQKMLRTLRSRFIPNKVVLFLPSEGRSRISGLVDFTKNLTALDHKATAYVCANFHCDLPTTDPGVMLKLLQKDR